MASFAEEMKSKGVKAQRGPVWLGPEAEGWNGGVTQSLIARWLQCRERFRVRYVEGWQSVGSFNHRISYGLMWHLCEEYADNDWNARLWTYAAMLCKQYPESAPQIQRWQQICRMQFSEYLKHWSKPAGGDAITPLLSEEVFDVPYALPSGRTVRLRGRWDGVGLSKKGEVWLLETKTRGEIDQEQIERNLTCDLQTMTYLVALRETWKGKCPPKALGSKLAGVRYNVVLRPLSGGKGTIVQGKGRQGSKCSKCQGSGDHILKMKRGLIPFPRCPKCKGLGRTGGSQPETDEQFLGRLRSVIADSPDQFFQRWWVTITEDDILSFRRDCLDPILEAMCNWYACFSPKELNRKYLTCGWHWRHPYGIDNPIDTWGGTEVDYYLRTGSPVGLTRVDRLFPELQE